MTKFYQPHEDCQIQGLAGIYQGIFGCKKDGMFVEVGAFDGFSYSNTVFLADIGWSGIYIEPMEHLAERCRKYHTSAKIKVINCAVGDGSDITIMHDGYELFTADPYLAKKHGAVKSRGVFHTKRLDDILLENEVQPFFDLLVIDVEGMEEAVLKGFACELWLPKLVIVETHELNPDPVMSGKAKPIDKFFLDTGEYMKIYTSDINTIYVRVEYDCGQT